MKLHLQISAFIFVILAGVYFYRGLDTNALLCLIIARLSLSDIHKENSNNDTHITNV